MQLSGSQQAGKQKAGGRANLQSLGRALNYLTKYPRLTAGATVALIIATAAQLVVPQLLQRIIDTIVTSATHQGILNLPANIQALAAQKLGLDLVAAQAELDAAPRALITAALIIVLFAFARGLFAFGQNFMSQALSESIAFDLRNDIFTKIQRLSFSYHDRNRTGQLMIRATDDVERLRVFIGQGLLMALQALILLVGTLAILAWTNIRLTLVVLPVLPLALGIFMLFGIIAQPLFVEVQKRLGRVNTTLQENLAGLKVVKAFTAEEREEKRFHENIDSYLDQRIKVSRVFSFLFPFIFLIANLGQGAVLYFGGRQIIDGTLTLGEWQKFSLYLVYVFIPMGQLGFIISLMAQAGASADRIFEILDAKNDVENKPGAIDLGEIDGRVEFKDVSFRYFPGGEAVLSHIGFIAEPFHDDPG